MKPFTAAAAVLLGIVALAHLYRLIWPVEIIVGGQSIPQWVSIGGLLVPGALSLALWREARGRP